MANIGPGDPLSLYPSFDKLRNFPLQIPRLDCISLGPLDSGPFAKFPPRAADRDAVIGQMNGIRVPEPFKTNEFGRAGFPFVAELMRVRCIWEDHPAVQYSVQIDLNEGLSPTNFVTAPQVNLTPWWSANTSAGSTVMSGTPPSDFAYKAGGDPWSADLLLEPVDAGGCDVAIHCVATFHTPGGFTLAGTPEVQERRQGCSDFHDGRGLFFFWTAVHFNPGDPIGLVKSMGITVRGSSIYMM